MLIIPYLLMKSYIILQIKGQEQKTKACDWSIIPGSLKQIDHGLTTSVWGVNRHYAIYRLKNDKSGWQRIPGELKHVSVGKAGVWGVNRHDSIFYRVGVTKSYSSGNSWRELSGKLKQIDSGPRGIVYGVSADDKVWCRTGINHATPFGTNWKQVTKYGRLKYVSCGVLGCWGVNSANQIWYRSGVTKGYCVGTGWYQVPGSLKQIEVGAAGDVYGINSAGKLYRRTGITKLRPKGSDWKKICETGSHITTGLNGQYMLVNGQIRYSLAKPNVTINCSSHIRVKEGDDITCLCKDEGGNPPASVTWYKDGVQIGVAGDEKKMLTLSDIDKTASGTYKCLAQSRILKDEKSIAIIVDYTLSPTVTSLTSTPEKATIGQSVVIICEATAVPVPSYTIIHNNTEVVSNKTIYFINVVKYSDIGSYKCIAKNLLGVSSKKCYLSAVEKAASSESIDGSKWYIIVVVLVSGFIIGIIFSYIFVCFRRRFRNRKPQSSSKPETIKKVSSIYQDLDLSKMNSEDNYQSLKMDSGRNDADYENQNDTTYTELNKVRDVENSYQSST